MDQRQRDALDNHITGHYGEDQFRGMVEPSRNTDETRRISHELVEAWDDVYADAREEISSESQLRMQSAMDAIIAALTPGYNAESDPEYPEEYDADDQPTADALRWEMAGTIKDGVVTMVDLRPECGCGHPFHVGLCLGTGVTLDPIYNIPADQPCVCVEYVGMD